LGDVIKTFSDPWAVTIPLSDIVMGSVDGVKWLNCSVPQSVEFESFTQKHGAEQFE
jgi:hypothetical protein